MTRSGMVWHGLAFNFKNIRARRFAVECGSFGLGTALFSKTSWLGMVRFGTMWFGLARYGYFFLNILAG